MAWALLAEAGRLNGEKPTPPPPPDDRSGGGLFVVDPATRPLTVDEILGLVEEVVNWRGQYVMPPSEVAMVVEGADDFYVP